MIDLHNHILPGLDDGCRNWREALGMARVALDDGISQIVCTPHWIAGEWENDSQTINMKLAQLRQLLANRNLSLQVHAGAELRLDPRLPSFLERGEVPTIGLGRRYALIELPMLPVLPSGLPSFCMALQARGIVPVLAHPERYPWVIENPSLVYRWVREGFLVQITAASLIGLFGRDVMYVSRTLLEHQLVHVLASDSHGIKRRSPKLARARRLAAEIVGEEVSWRLVHDHPGAILAGEPLDPPDPIDFTPKSKPFWQRILPFSRNRTSDKGRKTRI